MSSDPKSDLVVRLQRKDGEVVQGCDVYVGRNLNMGGWKLSGSKWANPFKVGKDGTVEECVVKYYNWINSDEETKIKGHPYIGKPSELRKDIKELENKVLGCWCKKKKSDLCHGDVLNYLANGYLSPELEKLIKNKQNK